MYMRFDHDNCHDHGHDNCHDHGHDHCHGQGTVTVTVTVTVTLFTKCHGTVRKILQEYKTSGVSKTF